MLNLAHFLDLTTRTYPDSVAVILDERKMTYAELNMAAKKVASALAERGIGRGDKVALMVPNTPHFPIIYYGILYAGATVVPVNVLYQWHEIEHYLKDSGAKAFFAFRMFEEEALKAFQQVETCERFIRVSTPDDLEAPTGCENFMGLVMSGDENFDTVQTMPDDTAVILYTSGTTGAPKGAELTHFNLFFNAHYCATELNDLKVGDVVLCALPLFHSFGQTCLMNSSVVAGGTITLVPRFETDQVMEVIQRDKVKLIALVPTMYSFILNAENWEDYDFSTVETATSGGAALPGEVHKRFEDRYGITIMEGYGLSETSPVASFTLKEMDLKVGSIGKPIWGVDFSVRGEDGSMLGDDEVGEICIRGHNIMKGYLNRPEATAEALKDGWFHSGDMGYRDSDGYYFIVDRKKDLIIRGGMNIYPGEIEEVLYEHPKVFEAAVIGIPDELRGEEVKFYVAARSGETITEEEVRTHVEANMAKYKWPKEIEILDELPKGATGKILKRELRELNK